MHGNLDLILTLTGGLGAALACGYVTQRIGLSPIVGYLLGGIVVGPYTPGFNANQELAAQCAEIGVILLMFGVGMQFHIEELLAVRKVVVPGAFFPIAIVTSLGAFLAHALGWAWSAGFMFGLSISVTSTVVLLRVLSDSHDLHTQKGHIAVGWLVVEDLFTVLALVFLPAIFDDGAQSVNLALVLSLSVLKLVVMIALVVFIGGKVVPALLGHIASTRSRELFTLTVLVVALGIAVGSAKLFGTSMALGAFLAGLVVGRSEFSLRAATEALPMRDAFAVLFFVSVGMLFHPEFLTHSPIMVVATLGIILVGKPLAALGLMLLMRHPLGVALPVSLALAQIGEFSFIMATMGQELGLLGEATTDAIVAASIISITLNPILYRSARPLERWVMGRPKLRRWLSPRHELDQADAASSSTEPKRPGYFAVVIGYGPVGETVSRLLRDNNIEPRVIELNIDTVRRLQELGIRAYYGDAARHDILLGAGVDRAIGIILSSSGVQEGEEVIRIAREINPKIRIIARTNYLREQFPFREAGADAVFSGEGEVALAMTEFVLRSLGATPDQIDRERRRVHSDLLQAPAVVDLLQVE
jgi:CPA2 family monovalent cation:H+ antiporter-2